MKIIVGVLSVSRSLAPTRALREDYAGKIKRYTSCETQTFASEEALLSWLDRQAGRTVPVLILLDSRGEMLSSEEIAQRVARLRDSGTQTIVFAIGPADGWSETARQRADFLWSFGRITLPHELAAVVLTEQIYRAFTILAGHPYHSGH